jgi:hypothetical protein
MAFFAARDIVRVDDTTLDMTLLYPLSRVSSIRNRLFNVSSVTALAVPSDTPPPPKRL